MYLIHYHIITVSSLLQQNAGIVLVPLYVTELALDQAEVPFALDSVVEEQPYEAQKQDSTGHGRPIG